MTAPWKAAIAAANKVAHGNCRHQACPEERYWARIIMDRDRQAPASLVPSGVQPGQGELKESAAAALRLGADIPCILRQTFPFSDSLMYGQVLSHTWTNYMFVISGQHDPSRDPDTEMQECGQPRTVSLADILPSSVPGEESSGPSTTDTPRSQGPSSACVCRQCGTDKTSLWRRRGGLVVCNACALYERLHGVPRPARLLNQSLRRRNRSDASRKARTL